MNIIDLKNIFVPEHIAYLLRSIGFNFKCLLRQQRAGPAPTARGPRYLRNDPP